VREALFSILGDVEGARVLDLYAGSGALRIEALSRGAPPTSPGRHSQLRTVSWARP
jgi:16S rRNA G966 N2-methylase RsmD